MSNKIFRILHVIILMGLFVISGSALSGCTDTDRTPQNEFLIRLGDNILTVDDYNNALEIAKTAYTHADIQDAHAFKAVQLRLLNQLMEELMLISRAQELNIRVTEEAVDAAAEKIKEDYPDSGFEQILLENAVSYNVWKKRLKIRMLMDKVVDVELEDRIIITPEDIKAYYMKNYMQDDLSGNNMDELENISEKIVNELRRRKKEEAYAAWIKELQNSYKDKIEINNERWEMIIGS